jgi:hypothetical protein
MPKQKIEGIQMAVNIACSASLTINHKYADTKNDNITARRIK